MRAETVVGVFDMDTATTEAVTKDFLSSAQRDGRLIVTTYELPKSFILTVDDMVTLSQLSTSSLAGRISSGDLTPQTADNTGRKEISENKST